MNTQKLGQLVKERQAKQNQVRAAMNNKNLPDMLDKIRERREIDERIAAERRSGGRRVMVCDSKLIAH